MCADVAAFTVGVELCRASGIAATGLRPVLAGLDGVVDGDNTGRRKAEQCHHDRKRQQHRRWRLAGIMVGRVLLRFRQIVQPDPFRSFLLGSLGFLSCRRKRYRSGPLQISDAFPEELADIGHLVGMGPVGQVAAPYICVGAHAGIGELLQGEGPAPAVVDHRIILSHGSDIGSD